MIRIILLALGLLAVTSEPMRADICIPTCFPCE